ncbi:MAG TPA: class I SAM-dependent methyltransferase [Pyrinomonadaceae bacterium]|jgi:SAM-dependent methyltransferase
MMSCPLCNSSSEFAFVAKGIDVLDCTACGHRFAGITAGEQHVASVYADDYFTGGGAGYSDYSSESEMLRRRGQDYATKIAKHASPGRILDVGAAAGYILDGFIDKGWSGLGLEPNAAMASLGRERSVDVRQGSLESFSADEQFDLVSMVQVAAHFYDPRTAFEKARKLLKPDGLLLIETWDRGSISARIFGRNWHEYSPPSVLNWWSKDGLDKFLTHLDLTRIDGGRPSKKISGGHVRSLLKYRLGDNFLLKLIPERLNFPYPSEDLFWALYKKN